MNPITREEQYLNRLTGEEGIIPDKPVTREEQYFARLCGGDNVIPDKPVTRREQYLATLCGEDVITPTKPVTRIEQYMAFASGESESKPEKPITREEMYWDKYQGGDVPEEKTIAFTDIITVTDALARPAVDLQSEITATQNLNGYEYPWVGGAGKNKLDVELPITLSGEGNIGNKPCVLPSGTYTFTSKTSTSCAYVLTVYNGSGTEIARGTTASASTDFLSVTFTTTEESAYIRCYYNGATTITHMQIESGSTFTGYAPYENICPISGRTEVNVTRTGANVWDEEWKQGDIVSSSGIEVTGDKVISKNYCEIKPNTSYYIIAPSEGNMGVFYYDENKTFISMVWSANRAITTPSNAKYFKLRFPSQYGTSYNNDGGLLYPSTATEYEPYEGDTFNTELGRTVYGGTLDLTTGELTITHAYADLGDFTWAMETLNTFRVYINEKKAFTKNYITTSYRTVDKASSVDLANGETTSITTMTHGHTYTYVYIKDERATTAEEFKTLVTGQKMVYELATPQTISLTPTEVQMFENNNTIWADSGRVQLTYLSKAAERVQLMNASLKANTLKLSKGAIKE